MGGGPPRPLTAEQIAFAPPVVIMQLVTNLVVIMQVITDLVVIMQLVTDPRVRCGT